MNIEKLNTATKYPEIPTYHVFGDKGMLQPELSIQLKPDTEYHASEKIHGTNTRIIFVMSGGECDYFIGSREKLLHARRDRIYNPEMNIVDNVNSIAYNIAKQMEDEHMGSGIYTLYGELYGGKMPEAHQYTSCEDFSYRCFDMTYLSTMGYIRGILSMSIDEISTWRRNFGQKFYDIETLDRLAKKFCLIRAPHVKTFKAEDLPTGVAETYEFLKEFRTTQAGIDTVGNSEGIVLRAANGSHQEIAKLRFEDYERTLGLKGKKK